MPAPLIEAYHKGAVYDPPMTTVLQWTLIINDFCFISNIIIIYDINISPW